MTIYVQMPDTLALNTNSRVRVADVWVGTVRDIRLKNWIATLTLDLDPAVKLPVNATAKIGQTSLLGTQHVELAAPPNPSPQPLRSGDTIGLTNSSAYPTIERTLASIAVILNGGGIAQPRRDPNRDPQHPGGHVDQFREFLGRLDTFTAELNRQRDDLTRAIDSTNQLLTIVADRNDTLDRVLTDLPPLIQHFADTRDSVRRRHRIPGAVQRRRQPGAVGHPAQPAPEPAVAAAAAQATRPGLHRMWSAR